MASKLFLATIALAIFSLSFVSAQEEQCPTEQDIILEPKQADEMEFEDPEKQDGSFDDSILRKEDRPDEGPEKARVEEEYNNFVATSRMQYEKAEAIVPYFSYLDYPNWYYKYLECCPRSQDYDCRSVSQRMPCFYNSGQWCCPFWPTMYIANCNCRNCIRQCPKDSSKCFAEGKCYRRYSLRSFWAVCWNKWWGIIRYFKQYVPTSCYCSAYCPPK